MKQNNLFSILIALVLSLVLIACGEGGLSDGSGSSTSSDGSGSSTSNDTGSDTEGSSDQIKLTQIKFDFSDAVGLALSEADNFSVKTAKEAGLEGNSNLMKVNVDNTLSDAVVAGQLKVKHFLVTNNDQIYLLLDVPYESCILLRVHHTDNPTSEDVTCVDSTLSSVNWNNGFNDPIQFDCDGNIYYRGVADGKSILRKNSNGKNRDLINDNINLNGFVVHCDGRVLITGSTQSTGVGEQLS